MLYGDTGHWNDERRAVFLIRINIARLRSLKLWRVYIAFSY
jgi:hypothetical protein